jgi:DNA-binding IscR family transcriptional regulator
MSTFNQNVQLDEYLKQAEPGLERAILRVLQPREGRACAISRNSLIENVESLGISSSDRILRAKINELRKKGHLICSTGGKDGGYWLAADWNELTVYLRAEVLSRALDLLNTEEAMKKAAEKRWGPEQPPLF